MLISTINCLCDWSAHFMPLVQVYLDEQTNRTYGKFEYNLLLLKSGPLKYKINRSILDFRQARYHKHKGSTVIIASNEIDTISTCAYSIDLNG